MKKWHSEMTDKLVYAITHLEKEEDCYKLLEDLCTIKEIIDMSQRLEVASLLKDGKNYQEINKELGVSTATISRVNKCITYGEGGYELAVDIVKSRDK